MKAVQRHVLPEGRGIAAFLLVSVALCSIALTAGCGAGNAIVRSSFGDILPSVLKGTEKHAAERARQLPYASLDLSIDGRGGLIVMAREAGPRTYFQSATRDVIGLKHGYLAQTAGLKANLLLTRLRYDDGTPETAANYVPPWQRVDAGGPIAYQVQRQWRDGEGMVHTDTAQAMLACDANAADVELPLATIKLQRCRETLTWASGETTQSTLWRDPDERMLWRVQTVAWPNGPEIAWRVARPWW